MRCMMKTNKGILGYFLSRSLFLGGGISTLFLYSSKDAYLAIILGTILGIGIIYITSYVNKNSNVSLKELIAKKNILNIIIRIVYIIYLLFLIFIILIILATFLYSYFLPFTPSVVSCLPFIFLATFLNPKNINKITYVAQVLFVISLFLIFIKTILLVNEFDFSNILPVFSVKPQDLLKTTIIFTVLSTAPFITLVGEKIEFKQNLKYYLISMTTILVVVFSIIIVLGECVNIYSYPEYSVLRKISLFNFIENIENFVSAGWFFDIFIALSLCSLKFKELINAKRNIIPFGIIFILLIIVSEYVANNFYNSMAIYKVFPWIMLGFIIILLLLLTIKTIIKKKRAVN